MRSIWALGFSEKSALLHGSVCSGDVTGEATRHTTEGAAPTLPERGIGPVVSEAGFVAPSVAVLPALWVNSGFRSCSVLRSPL